MIHHTVNDTTTACGQAIATVIAATVAPDGGKPIYTLELVYPRYIHSELMTHRMFSRNAASSRATPLSVTLEEVRKDPVLPTNPGTDKPGMVAGEPLDLADKADFYTAWAGIADTVADAVSMLQEKYHVHKEVLNRALEPWLRIRTVVTSTDWDNFFRLRLAPDAQPDMQCLAHAIKDAMAKAEVKVGTLHTPYVTKQEEQTLGRQGRCYVSVARCARVSYARHDGKAAPFEEDVDLFKRLMRAGHLSPFEHCAAAIGDKDKYCANLCGWASFRFLNADCDADEWVRNDHE